ncbi:MAG: hypothetical protein HY207_00570 [Nitrospirae bacterium]|nr:hypothetical protein [Nitrospirota bacterium]
MKITRALVIGIAQIVLGVGFGLHAQAQTVTDYTAIPPFVGNANAPNVLLLLDNSGSMNDRAYVSPAAYSATTEFGGYFDPTQCYSYASNTFSVAGTTRPCGTAGNWDGNFLNWLMMSRIEVAKWVMTGGKCTPRSGTGNCDAATNSKLIFETAPSFSVNNVTADGVTPFSGTRCFIKGSGSLTVKNTNCSSATTGTYTLNVKVAGTATGVIQSVGNKARFGLMEFKGSGDGGKVLADVGSNTVSMMNAIDTTVAATWTPLGESLYEASRYFAQVAPAYTNSDYSYTVATRDPYYFDSSWLSTPQVVPCCKSFVMIFTDGQPTQDLNIPSAMQDVAHTAANHAATGHHSLCGAYYGGGSSDPCLYNGSHYLDDVAYWAHTTDLRQANIPVINVAGKDLPGMQNLTVYTFYAFGTGSNLLKDAAKTGGFTDLNGDGLPGPDPKEWDDNGDGVPDTYFESADAFDMRDRLLAAITDILKRSASGTSVSILATSEQGDGALYQAYFYPSKFEGINELRWLGYLRGLFVDTYGNLREDTDHDGKLVLKNDRIVKMNLDPATNLVKADLYNDTNEDGVADTAVPVLSVGLDSIESLWEAGKQLALRDASARTIYTWIDSNRDGVVDNGDFSTLTGEALSFANTNAATLKPYLRGASTTEASNIIDWIRGVEVSGYRDRCLTISGAPVETGCTGNQRVWKLGDIISSTPTVVAAPKEQYDLIYGDTTYTAFRKAYVNRRNVVYVGANDGILHAFNAGMFTSGDDSTTAGVTERVRFQANPSTGSGWSVGLGDELWGFVPYDDLPHLKWLTQSSYTHVYYVDLKPKVTDVRIFNDAATGVSGLTNGQTGVSHPNGWGTILIVGLRYGGGAIDVDLNGNGTTTDAGEKAFRSSYYALDVTNPEKPPRLLWRFTDSGLGLTTSYPGIMHFKASGVTTEKWYMVVGSGPDNQAPSSTLRGYDGSSNQTGKVFVVNLLNGALLNSFSTDSNAFMGDPSVADGNFDFNADAVYIGNAIKNAGTGTWTNGKTYRLVTDNKSDPTGTNWTLSTLINQNRPLLVTPATSKDDLNNLWVFFGTGRFLSVSDKSNADLQTIYGIKDPCWTRTTAGTLCASTYTKTDLLDSTNVLVSRTQGPTQVSGSTAACGGTATCDFNQLVKTARSKQGWFVDLSSATPSERVLSPGAVLGGIAMFTSFIPNSDICALLGDSFVWALYYETGTAFYKPVIGDDGTHIDKRDTLGKGLPTTVGLAIGQETTGFVQTSTGTIVQVTTQNPDDRSRVINWMEGTGGGGTAQVQTIYRHLVK